MEKKSKLFKNRYDRNFAFLSEDDQAKLLNSRVCVIGLGGLGGCVMEMLARAGVGSLKGIDPDKFEISNLNRQIFSSEKAIGEYKASAALKRLSSINSGISAECINISLNDKNAYTLIQDSDIVIDCLDSIKTRFILQGAARKNVIPMISGAIAGASGQVTSIFPQDKGLELIYGKENKHIEKGIEENTGTLSFGVFFISSIQVSEAIKILLKKNCNLRNKLFIADLWTNNFDIIDIM